MTSAKAREEILAAITFYEERGTCWISVVTYLGINHLFGSWSELVGNLRRPWGRMK